MQKEKVKETRKKRLLIKILTIIATLLIVVGLAFFMLSGDNAIIIHKIFNEQLDNEELIELIRSFGIRGSITLSILSMMQVIIPFMPEEPVQVLTGMGYGIWHGLLICLTGIMVGNGIIFAFHKIFGKRGDIDINAVQENVALDLTKLRSSNKIALLILLMYILPAVPLGVICLFACSVDMKYPRYLFLTTIGSIPSILVGVSLGHMTTATSWIVSVVVFSIIIILVIIFAFNKKKFYKKVNEYIRKHEFYQNSEVYAKKPNKLLYFFLSIGARVYIRRNFMIKSEINAEIENPSIVLCNHGSFADFLFVYSVLMKKRPSVLMARMYFYKKQLAFLLKRMGAFPKSMFSTDIENAKNCLRVIADKQVLIMMPEARLSTAGKFEDIQDTTIKFLKKMGVPLYSMHISGDYLAMPKWKSKWQKKPLIELKLDKLVDGQEIKNISEPDLQERVEKALYYDEFKWLETHKELHYKDENIAEGLENILYKCPKCGKILTISSYKNHLFCTECGLRATVNDRYGFVDEKPFVNFGEWYEWQKQELKKAIESDKDYKLESRVSLSHPSKDGKTFVSKVGYGTCTLERRGLTYKGTCDGEKIEKFFPMSTIYRLLFGAGEDFEIYENKMLWYFVPDDRRSSVIWYNASEILKNLSKKE